MEILTHYDSLSWSTWKLMDSKCKYTTDRSVLSRYLLMLANNIIGADAHWYFVCSLGLGWSGSFLSSVLVIFRYSAARLCSWRSSSAFVFVEYFSMLLTRMCYSLYHVRMLYYVQTHHRIISRYSRFHAHIYANYWSSELIIHVQIRAPSLPPSGKRWQTSSFLLNHKIRDSQVCKLIISYFILWMKLTPSCRVLKGGNSWWNSTGTHAYNTQRPQRKQV